MTSPLFVDSWGWIILANRGEEQFESARSFYTGTVEAGFPVITTDYILAEVITFLYRKVPPPSATRYLKDLFASIDAGAIRMERIAPDRFEKAWRMRVKYQDHPKISFTDFASFVVMKEVGIEKVLTNDRHFEEVNLGFQRVP